MKTFLTQLKRLFWSRGFLKFTLWAVTLSVLFYVEENWRGARAWAATKASWEAKGEVLDFKKLTPPPIPDDQNLGALPLFKLERQLTADNVPFMEAVALHKALHPDEAPFDFPSFAQWQKGELPDLSKIKVSIHDRYEKIPKDMLARSNSLAQLDALYPFLNELRTESARRPFCRFEGDYDSPPFARSFVLLTGSISISRLLVLHALLALDSHRADVALEDIKTNAKLMAGVRRDPSLIAGLVVVAGAQMGDLAIYQGLSLHAWNDAQLAELQTLCDADNFLSDYQYAMRGEVAAMAVNIDYIEGNRNLKKLLVEAGSWADIPTNAAYFSPKGWWDQNKVQIANGLLGELSAIDAKSQRVDVAAVNQMEERVNWSRSRWDADSPWNVWASLGMAPLNGTAMKFAQAQVWSDEAQLACALERYRLAQGGYPAALENLVPVYMKALPHDIINGEPYHYQLRPDGKYLLYSIGWNLVDDGGTVVYEKDSPNRREARQGDWSWPVPK